jgi:methyl-accepting chemotaxis protein
MDLSFFSRARSRLVGAPIGFSLSIILLLGLVPALVMGVYFVQARQASIEIMDRELKGIELLRRLEPVGHYIISPPIEKQAIKSKAASAWTRLNRAMRDQGSASQMDSKKHFSAVLGKLQMVADGYESDPRPAYDALITRISDQSGLVLSTEIENYYLMDVVVNKSRRLARAARELRDVRELSGNTRGQLEQISKHRVSDAARDLQTAAVAAIRGNTDETLARSSFLPSINATVSASNNLVAANDVWASYWVLVEANRKSWEASAEALERSLQARRQFVMREMQAALAVSSAVLLLAILLAGLVIAAITGGLRRLSQRLELMSLGDYTSEVPGTEYRNDIGVIAGALQHFVDMSGELDAERARAKTELEQTVAEVRRENEALLSQALDRQAEAQQVEREAVARLARQLESQMSDLLAGSRTAAHQMDREAGLMADSTNGVQREASAAALAANQIRRSVEAVTPEVQAVAQRLQAYTQSLGEAKDLAKDAVKRVDVAKSRISEFDEATGRAGAMLELIAKIARKTNMLALNASIEAVRVGEAGQGFMVVAEEVKALARSTRDAAQEISSQIKAMEGANSAVASAFGEVLDVVNVLAAQSDSVATGMNHQTAAMSQVNDIISHASADLSNMVQSIDGADKSATVAIERSSEMLVASKSVSDSVDTLDKSVRAFLGGLQSAQRHAA